MSEVLSVGLIGAGNVAQGHMRGIAANDNIRLAGVMDIDGSKAEAFVGEHGGKAYTQLDALLDDPEIDAVHVCSIHKAHAEQVIAAARAGKHVLVEKPMTSSTEDAQDLINLADEVGKVLMVDHTFLYTGAVRYIKQAIDNGDLGDIHYIDSTRINLGLFQKDINVLWDLAPHDISICSYLLGKRPKTVQAVGASHTNTQIENIAYFINI